MDGFEKGRVVVAMSGGVDSSVAAALLREQGYDAVGISMQVWDYGRRGGCESKSACCAPSDFSDARRVAARIDIPYYVYDFEESFRKEVIERFISSYRNGVTPNPCVDCNTRVKFGELRKRSRLLGAAHIATGHYAVVERRPDGYHLLRGRDPAKDQSYFLYTLGQQELSETLFPVGEMTKSEVREVARRYGLATAEKAESQDICFVEGGLSEFLRAQGVPDSRGDIVDRAGKKVGEHDGIHSFTVGQRRGLRVGGSEKPLYVIEIDGASNRVIVGGREQLECEEFLVGELSACAPSFAGTLTDQREVECLAQVRYRHPGVPVRVSRLQEGVVSVRFVREWTTVSPGQAAVFYDLSNREVLGGGRIARRAAVDSPELGG